MSFRRTTLSLFAQGALALLAITLLLMPPSAHAQTQTAAPSALSALDSVQINVTTGKTGAAGGLSVNLQLLFLFTVLSLAPAILIMTTSFVRIVIVLSFLRSALTVQQPPNQVLISLALFLTAFIMAPTFDSINKQALVPLREGKIQADEAITRGSQPLKIFMLRYAREKELRMFVEMSATEVKVDKAEDLPLNIIIPAFMLSELKTGFQMGLLILLPFVVIDMVVASVLMSLGMMMLPPTVISLPLKIMVFVLIDGWTLIVRSLVMSFSG
jgi:flagellar biosynthetic protein FliP